MSLVPAFTATPRVTLSQVTAANTARDGTGTVVDLFTGGSSGSRIEHIEITAPGTVTAGVVRIFLYDGTNTRLLEEILVTATTPSTTVKVFRSSLSFASLAALLLLPSNSWKLRGSTHNAETFNIIVTGGDF